MSRRGWLMAGVLILMVAAACGAAAGRLRAARQGSGQAGALGTATVTTITAVSGVESSGSVAARQTASVFWETTGLVATVEVQVGDRVQKGQVLMTLDPGSAPQNVIQARAELIEAQNALDALLHPSALSVANAQKAVADAQQQLEDAERDLRNTAKPAISYYEDQVAEKRQALEEAQQNAEKANIGELAVALENARKNLETKTNQLNDARSAQAQCPECTTVFAPATGRRLELSQAEREYEDAANAYRVAELNDQQALARNEDAVENAQEALDTALANLTGARAGPDALDLAQKQAAAVLAEARLADAQAQLDGLLNGADPDEIAAAEVRVEAAQATLGMLVLRAPIEGEVLVVNDQAGDAVVQSRPAVVIADRSQLHVEASIDESEVTQIEAGDEVTLTLDSLPGLALPGSVARINPVGQTVQGLVKYTVRVDLLQTDPRVLLGMTANVNIVTGVQEGALAVPLDAVQLDDRGEFVNRMTAVGTLERVDVVSGQVQDEWVTVAGDLRAGDTVQIVVPAPTNNGGPFGPG